MVLRISEIRGVERSGVEAFVDIAVEREHGLLRILRAERGRPVGVSLEVESRERIGDMHETADFLWRELAQRLDEFGGICGEFRQRVLRNVRRGLVVERFGRRENDYHSGSPACLPTMKTETLDCIE